MEWNLLQEWQARGWSVQLVAMRDGWGVRIETPDNMARDTSLAPREIALRFTTAIHPTPQEAIRAAAEVLR